MMNTLNGLGKAWNELKKKEDDSTILLAKFFVYKFLKSDSLVIS